MENSQNFNIESINSSLLAGLYASGHNNLHELDLNIYSIIKNENSNIILSKSNKILLSILVSIINTIVDTDKKIYLIMKEKTALTFYNMVNDVLKFMNDIKIQHIINENINLDD